MINIEDISKQVASELGLRPDLVERIIRLPWKATKDSMVSYERRPVLHIYLGKFRMKDHKNKLMDDPGYIKQLLERDEIRLAKRF